jgi:predicted acylesterase/phospholipase RssA
VEKVEDALARPPVRPDDPRAQAVRDHLDAARRAAEANRNLGRIIAGWSGADVANAWTELHSARQALLLVADEDEVRATVPTLVSKVRRYIGKSDPLRAELERILKAATPTAHLARPPLHREDLFEVRQAVDGASDQLFAEIKHFRNVLFAVTLILAGGLVAMVILERELKFLPLCPQTEATTSAPQASASAAPAVMQERNHPYGATTAAVACDSGCAEVIPVIGWGAFAGLLGAVFALRKLRPRAGPYALPVSQAALRVPLGAATALAGIVLLQSRTIDALDSVRAPAVYAYVLLFGFSQELVSRLIDKKAGALTEATGPAAGGEGGSTGSRKGGDGGPADGGETEQPGKGPDPYPPVEPPRMKEGGDPAMEQLRMALTISGAVSLGAYEAGALAALLLAVQTLNDDGSTPPIRIDAIGGASAGSITGMLAARCLLEGFDPVHVMTESWVRRDSLAALRTRDAHAPLSIEAMRQAAVQLLDPDPQYRGRPRQEFPIVIHMALGCLRGLNYRISRLQGPLIDASTYLDWGRFTLLSGMDVRAYTEPQDASVVDFALASGANAFGFPPRALDRHVRDEDKALLGRKEITNLPPDWSGWLWYTDGGTIDNEPLGRTFDITNEIDADGTGRRLHLLIHPHPTALSTDAGWTIPTNRPNWTTTLARSDKLQRTHGPYDDLRHAEKTNSHIMWIRHFHNAVIPQLREHNAAWAAILRPVLQTLVEQKAALDLHEADAIQPSPQAERAAAGALPEDLDAIELFGRVLVLASGLSGKEPARIEVVSPLLLPEAKGRPVEDLLAGEFLLHFGGFLDERLRWHDFALGYRSMQAWLTGLEGLGVAQAPAELARNAVAARYEEGWNTGWGTRRLGNLPWRDRLQFVRLAEHVIRVLLGELLHRRP